MKKQLQLQVLREVSKNLKEDSKKLDGMPFNGKTLGTLVGSLMADISLLAEILELHIRESSENHQRTINPLD